ncbi:unnamed protein product [Kluyveromyces dobzhanskii CBS 2104]|uniref:WGS project CCBQ000000000 data, contig 00009 n=1 Tax=Kluyveromyces dobzhanskii CBS 2104 TaxID=1427455 RepID=A0A0A8L5G2_9SACH|nr:unnamed protein product [Kluyveromyces dobzhanskii CBS 2104]
MPSVKPIVSTRRFTRKTESLDDYWSVLQNGIDKIFDDRVAELSFEKLYTTVYGLVLSKNGPQLHDRLTEQLSTHFIEVRKSFDGITGADGLQHLNVVWKKQKIYLSQISDVFVYMDSVYSKRENKPDVVSLGSRLFLKEVVGHVSDMLKSTLVNEINEARKRGGEYAESGVIKDAISVLNTLELKDGMSSVFIMEFEPFLLESTEKYYKDLHSQLTQGDGTSHWKDFDTLLKLLKAEDLTCNNIFDDLDTISKFHNIAEKALVTDNIQEIARYNVAKIVNDDQKDVFSKLLAISSSQRDKNVIFNQLSQFIVKEVLSIEIDASAKKKSVAAVAWIQELIALRDKYYELGSNLSSEQAAGFKCINEAFGKASNQIKVFPEFLSLYFDNFLKFAPKEINSNARKCVHFFKLFKDKDAFEVIYRQQLSRRLLQQKSNVVREQELIFLLQEDVGTSYTSKLRGMLRDFHLSTNFMQKSGKTLCQTRDVSVNVLTHMFWPLQDSQMNKDVVIPDSFGEIKTGFENLYAKTHSGRLLDWNYHLSTVEIAYQFRHSYHELSMPMFSGVIFLLFKNHQSLTFDEIVQLTNLPSQEVRKNMITMSVAPKTRILQKDPPGKSISNSDSFSINHDFTAPQRKVKVLMVVLNNKPSAANDSTRSAVEKKLLNSRLAVINAAVTRIMKRDRKLYHSELQEKVIQSIPLFEMNSNLFKMSLEYLLDNEYLQRDFDNTTIYHYLP